MVGWNSIYRDSDRDYPTARVVRSGINIMDDLKKKKPAFLGVDCFDPHRATRRAARLPEQVRRPQGSRPRRASRRSSRSRRPTRGVIDVELDDETIERVRELYAAEISFMDQEIGRLMTRLDDLKLIDESVIIYFVGPRPRTLGEHGIVGKHGSRAQWHIYHVPFMIRTSEGKLAGQWDDYFASNHDITRTALSFMGARAPG